MKASETPEERRARRAAKKAMKAAASGGAGAGGGGGADTVAALAGGAQPFIWKKKYEKSIEEGLDPQILNRDQLAAKQAAAAAEIAAIKARKIARAEEKAAMEQLREQMARDAEAEQAEGWEEKEEAFHRKTALLRTEMRIAEGREKAIDILVKQRALWRKLKEGPTDEEKELHPTWAAHGVALDPTLPSAKDIELVSPHALFTDNSGATLPWRDLEYLAQDIQAQLTLHGNDAQEKRFWQACATLCADAVTKQKSAAFGTNTPARGAAAGQSSSSSAAVKDDIALLLRGKGVTELELLERDIGLLVRGDPDASATLRALADGLDHTYWETVLRELALFKCVAFLREFHSQLLQARLDDLQRFVRVEEELERARREEARAAREAAGEPTDDAVAAASYAAEMEDIEEELDFEPKLLPHEQFETLGTAEDEGEAAAAGREDSGSFSPVLVPDDEEEGAAAPAAAAASKLHAVDAEADARELAELRRQVAEQKQREQEERARMALGSAVTALAPGAAAAAPAAAAAAASSSADDASFRRELSRLGPVEGDEVQLKTDFAIPAQTHWWQDKYRARKPRFFNRVKTGYEWNKYNGAHYDKENPPPKIVQGYKFNIFYPDLIDPSSAPRFRIEPDPGGNPDFCVLRFMAGPPYEDLAFKIVNKEWEYSFKRGYKCVFDKGVLALYFNFRRYFYRR